LTEFVRVSNWESFIKNLEKGGYESFYLPEGTLKKLQERADEIAKEIARKRRKNEEKAKGHINEVLIAVKNKNQFIEYSAEKRDLLFTNDDKNVDLDSDKLPNYLRVDVEFADTTLSIIGTRIRSNENGCYMEKQLCNLRKHMDSIKNPLLAIGDFNCGPHYAKDKTWNWEKVFGKENGELISRQYSVHTPNSGFSNVNRGNLNSIDHIISKGLGDKNILISDLYYSWEFMSRHEEYRHDSRYPNFFPRICFPDHAILTADIEIKE